jgi:O-succinylbenzoate synthase
MTIVAVELLRVRLPLRRSLVSAHGTESVRDVVLVRAVDEDGAEGWGECSALGAPTYRGEYTDGAWAMLRDYLVPALLAFGAGGPIPPGVVGHPMAEAALSTAQLDLSLRSSGLSMVATLAAMVGTRTGAGGGLHWTAVLGVPADIDLTAREADAAVVAGADALKLKIRPSARCETAVAALIEAFPDHPVAVDANGSFRNERGQMPAIAALLASSGPARLDRPGTAPRRYVEQPLPADDLLGHADLARLLAVPIALDESIDGAGSLATAAHLDAADLINLKPARVGGISVALDLFADEDRQPAAFLGGMLETGVGRAAALAVGVVLGLDATDLGPSHWYFDDDITEPIELGDDGLMHAPDGPGIGVTPRVDRLAEVVVERLLIRP